MNEMVTDERLTTGEQRKDDVSSGEGVDRSAIRQRLALSPAERLRLAVREANNLAKFLSAVRP